MGKAQRIRETNARQRIAAQQAAARKAEARRRLYLASGSVVVVIAIVIGLIIAKNVGSGSATTGSGTAAQASQVTSQITTVPASTLDAVGKGTGVSPLQPTQGNPAALTSGGKPEILYVGAEYCPYCAAERWAMAVALSRFGTFSNLKLIHSSGSDVYPNTPTLSFYKSSYTSNYVDFQPVEWYSTTPAATKGTYKTLQVPTTAQMSLFTKYDAPPYVQSSTDAGSFPFIDIGNKYLVIGAQYVPSNLANLTWSQVASDIRNPSSPVAKEIDGTANSITAAICKVVPNAPAAVCNSAAVKAGAGML
jgi:thiol-disulfide isomerase/thioredoxin